MSLRSIEPMIAAATGDELWRVYAAAVTKCGFPCCFYIARVPLIFSGGLIHDDFQLFGNLPEPIMKQAVAERMTAESRWATWVRNNVGNIGMDQLSTDDEPDAIASLVQRHGFSAGQLFSLRDHVLRSHAALLLCPPPGTSVAQHQTLWREHRHDLVALSWIMHLRMATMPRHRPSAPLTKRQREVLQWTVAGKTIAEIALILGLTSATVEKHMRLARENLGVGTTAQAILKAHLTHQLFAPDEGNEVW